MKKKSAFKLQKVFSEIPAGWLGYGFWVVVCSLHELLVKPGRDRSINSSVDGIGNGDAVPSCSTALKINILEEEKRRGQSSWHINCQARREGAGWLYLWGTDLLRADCRP